MDVFQFSQIDKFVKFFCMNYNEMQDDYSIKEIHDKTRLEWRGRYNVILHDMMDVDGVPYTAYAIISGIGELFVRFTYDGELTARVSQN